MRKIELLAPAGTWEALEAAINAGADAVYLGGTAFGARQYADNFGREELQKAVEYAHLHRVSLYVTVNTLVDDSEMNDLGDYLVFLSNIGIDGIIVQDMGVVRLARLVVPDLPLHASTQMTITNSAGAAFAASVGMERAVVARETTLADLTVICRESPIEIEAFIHGALCVCYSGQCLMSSLIGGRSGNRGRCAQPCRLPYTLVNAEGEDLLAQADAGHYLLSPKDMNTLDVLPQMIEAGVVSFKIEGRMKRPEYVAVVVDIYRRAIDSYLAGNYTVSAEDKRNIEQIFNRDFTTAYLEKPQGRNMMSDRRPNNRGVLIGRVARLDKGANKALVKLEKELHVGDGLEFWVSVGGRVGTTVTTMLQDGLAVEEGQVGTQVEIDVPAGVRLNDRVFRTFDDKLMTYAGTFYGEHNKRRLPLEAVVTASLGQPLTIELQDEEGNTGHGQTDFIVETARKHPLDETVVRKQLERLGDSEYELATMQLVADDNVMVPLSELNAARRQATAALNEQRLEKFLPRRKQRRWQTGNLKLQSNNSASKHGKLVVEVDTLAKAKTAFGAGADTVIAAMDAFTRPFIQGEDYEELCATAKVFGKEWAVATPRIVSERELANYRSLTALWQKLQPSRIYIGNNSLWLLAQKTGLPLWLDFGMNQYNSEDLAFWAEQGAKGAVLSPELNMQQIEHILQFTPVQLECLVQGPIEMMVSEYCVPGSFLGNLQQGNCSFACRQETYLQDRKGEKFILEHDPQGRMHVLNGHDLSVATSVKHLEKIGIKNLRIDGRSYDEGELGKLVTLYRQILDGRKELEENLPHTTRGHYFRGVL